MACAVFGAHCHWGYSLAAITKRLVPAPSVVPSIVHGSPEALTGLFYGGGTKVLMAQCVGSLVVCTATFASVMAMFGILNAMGLFRVSKEGEMKGLDVDQHGISAYPEYEISPWASPTGMPPGSY
jgi:ammonia channel protein AmtB